MLCGPSFKSKGIQTFPDIVCAYLPSSIDMPETIGHTIDSSKEEVREVDPGAPASILALKIATDPFVDRLYFFYMYSDCIDAGSYVFNSHSDEEERISHLL